MILSKEEKEIKQIIIDVLDKFSSRISSDKTYAIFIDNVDLNKIDFVFTKKEDQFGTSYISYEINHSSTDKNWPYKCFYSTITPILAAKHFLTSVVLGEKHNNEWLKLKEEIAEEFDNLYKKRTRKVVALIGSTRFKDKFIEECWKLSMKGYICTLPNFRPENMMASKYDIPEDELEDIGIQRINLADEVYVVNKNKYVGSSTKKEIDYCKDLGIKITYMEE